MNLHFALFGWPELIGLLVVCSPLALVAFLLLRAARKRQTINPSSSPTAAATVASKLSRAGFQEIYVSKEGNTVGPYSSEEIKSRLQNGQLSVADLAWREGLDGWVSISTILEPVAQQSGQAPNATGPKGVGGWLLFFCVSLMFLSPVASFGRMLSDWNQLQSVFVQHPSLKSAVFIENVGFSLLLTYGFVVGCIICTGSPRGRSSAKLFLLIRLGGSIVIEVLALLLMGNLPADISASVAGGMVQVCVREAFIFLIWWQYFKKSVRVNNTYGLQT